MIRIERRRLPKASTSHPPETLFINVFVEDGERAVCAVLYRDDTAIATIRLDHDTVKDAVGEANRWLTNWRPTKDARTRFIQEVRSNFATLQRIRRFGHDPVQDYLGAAHTRRLPATSMH